MKVPTDGPAHRRIAPWWVGPVFGLGALALIPWMAYLGVTLPSTERISERTAWIGFDCGLMIMFILTGFLAHRHSIRLAQASMATATMLVVDAWFDIFTSGGRSALMQSLQLAVLEVGLAAVCVWISLHATPHPVVSDPS
ncbi:MAG TPA: hypothetical protein VGJ28_07980 [Micromonosporaceae bacterium]|jgi:uncharacterized membrane protein YbhN (UPF0104 family)